MRRETPGTEPICQTRVQNVVRYAQALLTDLEEFLSGLDPVFYREKLDVLGGSSIGGHVRHCIEHFSCFFTGLGGPGINYDHRARDPFLENEPVIARDRVRELLAELDLPKLREHLLRDIVVHGFADDTGTNQFSMPSTVGRELLYVAFHCLHHMAVVAMGARHCSIALKPNFGKAPATLAFESGFPDSRASNY